jgi:predicted transport protein
LIPFILNPNGDFRMAKSSEEMRAGMIENLKQTTGKSLPEWAKVVAASQLDGHQKVLRYLKVKHGVTHGYANLIALETLRPADAPREGEGLIDAQYAGAKAALRPIYDALLNRIKTFGGDIEISPKKAYVSLRRNKQFALIQPTTATRIDVGINLKGAPPTDRLELSGNFNAMVSHRVRLGSVKDIDKELEGWLKKAYEAA